MEDLIKEQSQEQLIEQDRQQIIEIITNLDGILLEDKNKFIDYLDKSNYFVAPYTSTYQYSYEGGLAKYSLDVYNNLHKLVDAFGVKVDEISLTLTSLFHSIAKSGYYEKTTKNVKEYYLGGSKRDNMGYYDWITKEVYTVVPSDKRFTMGDIGLTSYMILSKFFALTDEESASIIHSSFDKDTPDIYQIYGDNKLASLLHSAIVLTLNCLYE